MIIRRQFGELDDFRESMAGRSVNVRFGSQGSVIDWLLVPRLAGIRTGLGNAMVELEKVFARVSSFTELTKIVQTGQAAAVLPDLAAVDFDPKRYAHLPLSALRKRTLVLIANERSLERSGIASGAAEKLAELLKLD